MSRRPTLPRAAVLCLGLAVAATLDLVAGCTRTDSDAPMTASTDADRGSPTSDGATGPGAAPGTASVVDTGLQVSSPVDVAPAPSGDVLFVAERGGRVLAALPEGDELRAASRPVIDVTDLVGSTEGERGLLGLAVAPDGTHLYLSYTAADDGASQVDEFDLTDEGGAWRADPTTRRNLLDVAQPFTNHNGGHVEFGPDDMLYVGLGDGGSGGDPDGRGQDPTTLLGKLLRLDPTATPPVPTDNPFVGDDPQGARDEIWATGLRNPWRFSFDRDTGDLWIGDVGQDRVEEIDRLPAEDGRDAGRGANLGWDLFEGDRRFDDPDPAPGAAGDGPFVDPLFTYGRDQGCSVTGGVVYRGADLPALRGSYLYSDFCGTGVRVLIEDGDGVRSAQLTDTPGGIVGFGQTRDGEVLVLGLDQGVFRLVPA